MGGYGSGRHGGRPTVEDGLTVNLPLMFRESWIRDGGSSTSGRLTWSRNGNTFAKIGYSYSLMNHENAWLELTYTRTRYGEEPTKVEQRVRLTATQPNYGGRRWWMICPFTGKRVAKLHMPSGGDKFASREAWRLGYRSQRVAHRDRAFEQLFRLQRKLGCDEGWEAGLYRPKGMWNRTFERHLDRYYELDAQCSVKMSGLLRRLSGRQVP